MGTFSPNRGYQVPTVGGDAGPQFANEVNATIGIIDSNMGGTNSQSVAGNANVILTSTQAQSLVQVFTGVLTGNIVVEFPVGTPSGAGFWAIENNTTGNFLLTVATTALASSVVVAPGAPTWVFSDGINIVPASPKGWQELGFVNLAGTANSGVLPFPTTFFRRFKLTVQGLTFSITSGAALSSFWAINGVGSPGPYVSVSNWTNNTGTFSLYSPSLSAMNLTGSTVTAGNPVDAEASMYVTSATSLLKCHSFYVNTTPSWQSNIVDFACATPVIPNGIILSPGQGTFTTGIAFLEGYPL
jgi:hypothetical protein